MEIMKDNNPHVLSGNYDPSGICQNLKELAKTRKRLEWKLTLSDIGMLYQ
jgi:hypothetical protein